MLINIISLYLYKSFFIIFSKHYLQMLLPLFFNINIYFYLIIQSFSSLFSSLFILLNLNFIYDYYCHHYHRSYSNQFIDLFYPIYFLFSRRFIFLIVMFIKWLKYSTDWISCTFWFLCKVGFYILHKGVSKFVWFWGGWICDGEVCWFNRFVGWVL